ncbi:MAG: DUF4892 domain-containing protein [Endozoicomonadaceae bacterium]|nr:DUF4892 domain-containing protein [Endozoicomonadaceae bacterium]
MTMQRIRLFLWLIFVCVSANASNSLEAESLPGIERYPNAEIVRYAYGKKTNYPLVGSAVKKVNGIVRADEEYRLDGQWLRIIYLLPEGHTSDAGFQYFSDRLKQLKVEAIYQCENRHCGRSNLWANTVFEEANLYGLDKEQFYSLSARQVDGKTEYYVLYTVRRGNRRVYAMVDRLTVNASQDISVKAAQERRVPSDPLPGCYIDVVTGKASGSVASQDIDKIMAMLDGDRSIPLLLAGVSSHVSHVPVDQQLEASRQEAKTLQILLVEHGIPEEQLFVIGTGSLLLDDPEKGMPFVRVLPLK